MFFEKDGHPRQRITAPEPLQQWRYIDSCNDVEANELLGEHGRTKIRLSETPLLSVLLLKTGEEKFKLSVVSHHIVSDEWSAQVILRDLLEFYRSAATGQAENLVPLDLAYGEVAEKARQQLVSVDALDRISYWRSQLANVPYLDVPTDRGRSAHRRFRGKVRQFYLEREVYVRLRSVASRFRTTPFTFLTTAFCVLLYRYTGQTDICIGTNMAGRDSAKMHDLVGLLTKTLPLRNRVDPTKSFSELLISVCKTVADAQDHQVPLAHLVQKLDPPRIEGRNPFFDVTMVLQNVPRYEVSLPHLSVEQVFIHNGTCKFDLEVCLHVDEKGNLRGHWEYDCDLFNSETIRALDAAYHVVLENVVKAPDMTIGSIPLMCGEGADPVLRGAESLEVEWPAGSCWEFFHRQANETPHAIAVLGSSQGDCTYRNLLIRVQRLNQRLSKAGIEAGVLVGVMCERTISYLEAILAIQSCGAAFVPLDPALPDAVLVDMLDSGGMHALMVDEVYRPRLAERLLVLSERAVPWMTIDSLDENICSMQSERYGSDLAYVVYTSGSTGRPKGAMVSLVGMMNHLWSKVQSLDLGVTSVVAQTAPVCFDISIWQMCAPLLVGGTVAMVTDEEVMDVAALVRRISDIGATVVELVPSYIDLVLNVDFQVVPKPERLNQLLSTGEPLPVETCRRWFAEFPTVPIVNAYGPTECSDDVTQYVLVEPPSVDTSRIPIGAALPNVAIYILDEQLKPVPDGFCGEICIGGISVGLGYLGDAPRTKKAFVADPMSGKSGSIMYRTGDIGRRSAGGVVEYFGRRDSQIKLRGVRIEIDEIESIVNAYETVTSTAVVKDENGGSLVAFVEYDREIDRAIDLSELRAHVKANLPHYMVPSQFIPVERLPRTASGKLDRSALHSILPSRATKERNELGIDRTENSFSVLERIWCEVLVASDVSADADFFDHGGDSLKAMRIASLAQRKGLSVSTRDIIDERTLSAVWSRCCTGDVE